MSKLFFIISLLEVLLSSAVATAELPESAQNTAPKVRVAIEICPWHITSTQNISGGKVGFEISEEIQAEKLMSIQFYKGHPRKRMVLSGYQIPRHKEIVQWDNIAKENAWIECRYSNTRMILRKKMSSQYGACRVSYDLVRSIGGFPAITGVSCVEKPEDYDLPAERWLTTKS